MTTIAVAIVGRAITIHGAIQKRSHEPIYKPNTKIVAKLEEQYLNGSNREKSDIDITIWENWALPKNILH